MAKCAGRSKKTDAASIFCSCPSRLTFRDSRFSLLVGNKRTNTDRARQDRGKTTKPRDVEVDDDRLERGQTGPELNGCGSRAHVLRCLLTLIRAHCAIYSCNAETRPTASTSRALSYAHQVLIAHPAAKLSAAELDYCPGS